MGLHLEQAALHLRTMPMMMKLPRQPHLGLAAMEAMVAAQDMVELSLSLRTHQGMVEAMTTRDHSPIEEAKDRCIHFHRGYIYTSHAWVVHP